MDQVFYFVCSSVLGGFIDNHDHERFLHKNPSYVALRNNLVYLFMSKCIPVLYYGTEQGFNGGNDPNNRESLWPYMNTSHVLYTFIKHLIKVRNTQGNSWLKSTQIEQHVGASVYSFSREKILVVITTESTTTTIKLQSHPYEKGQHLKNLLNQKETFKVSSTGELLATLHDGEPLVLAESDSGGVKEVPFVLSFYICFALFVFTVC
jgi:alpha-amylase